MKNITQNLTTPMYQMYQISGRCGAIERERTTNDESMSDESLKKLNRFTTLPELLDLFQNKRLVLRDPRHWRDKNDSELFRIYKKIQRDKKGVCKVFALCFSYWDETAHHWEMYANGMGGCCIEFDMNKLKSRFSTLAAEGIKFGKVKYMRKKDVCNTKVTDDKILFIKRLPYEFEKEYRVIWQGNTRSNRHPVKIDLGVIKRITFSPDMPKSVYKIIQDYLRNTLKIPNEIKINHSTLYKNQKWIEKFRGFSKTPQLEFAGAV